jgi:hypothetical protein
VVAELARRGLAASYGAVWRFFAREGTVRNFVRRLGMIGAKEPRNAATQRASNS